MGGGLELLKQTLTDGGSRKVICVYGIRPLLESCVGGDRASSAKNKRITKYKREERKIGGGR